mmetsp:Transcript_91787/g.159203  ORF Transcript_91787/g.159203 Transcript_91787/m.159203 type:complete len:101 (-) Transcript_91787:773-1075(-)
MPAPLSLTPSVTLVTKGMPKVAKEMQSRVPQLPIARTFQGFNVFLLLLLLIVWPQLLISTATMWVLIAAMDLRTASSVAVCFVNCSARAVRAFPPCPPPS